MDYLSSVTVFDDAATLGVAAFAVFLVGLGKGGLGGALPMLGVPILSLAMPPFLAAAVMLPILLSMDAVSVWTWRRNYEPSVLKLMLPAAIVGIAVGTLAASSISDAGVKIVVGLIALYFVADFVASYLMGKAAAPRPQSSRAGRFWGTVAGFTSSLAHAGMPPYQVYALPLRLAPRVYTGTTVIFFASMNLIKLPPYILVGELDLTAFASAVALLPVAVVSTLCGAAIVKRMSAQVFYPMMYAALSVISVLLLWNGISEFR